MDVAVLGAGPLGRDLATLATRAGHVVHLHDEEATAAMDAIDEIEHALDDAAAAGELAHDERHEAIDRLDATTGLEAAVGEADLVVVTGRTDENELQETFAAVEEHAGRDAIVSTSTGGVSITVAAAGLRHPDRAIGLHVVDPLDARVVEVVVADQTGGSTLERAEAFVCDLGLVPAVVRDEPGFVSTRLALSLEAEAMRLVEAGVASVRAVDAAYARRYDLPMGPLERADRAGLDRRLETFTYLSDELGARFDPPEVLADLAVSGQTGADSGEGFYVWENGEPTRSALPDPDVVERTSGPDDPAR